jgi:hypothetical protein
VDARKISDKENAVLQFESTDSEPCTKRTHQGAASGSPSDIQGDLASITTSPASDFSSPNLPNSEGNMSGRPADCGLTLPPCNSSQLSHDPTLSSLPGLRVHNSLLVGPQQGPNNSDMITLPPIRVPEMVETLWKFPAVSSFPSPSSDEGPGTHTDLLNASSSLWA